MDHPHKVAFPRDLILVEDFLGSFEQPEKFPFCFISPSNSYSLYNPLTPHGVYGSRVARVDGYMPII